MSSSCERLRRSRSSSLRYSSRRSVMVSSLGRLERKNPFGAGNHQAMCLRQGQALDLALNLRPDFGPVFGGSHVPGQSFLVGADEGPAFAVESFLQSLSPFADAGQERSLPRRLRQRFRVLFGELDQVAAAAGVPELGAR